LNHPLQLLIKHPPSTFGQNDLVRRSVHSSINRTLEQPERPLVLPLSRAQTTRLFLQQMGETPGAFRNRLRLEQSAWQLSHTARSVTDLAFDAGFESLEAFSRAFKNAFAVSPSHFRRIGATHFQLPSVNRIHWLPKGENMDLLEIMLGHDQWLTSRMLEAAKSLSDAQLDAPVPGHAPLPFEESQTNLRQMFDRLIAWKEIWLAAMQGLEFVPDSEQTISGFQNRLERVAPAFLAVAKGMRDASNWQGAFVDHLCEPPEAFTFGGVIAHVLTFSAHQRVVMLEVLRSHGIHDLGFGDPLEFVRASQGISK
jgi:AraC family transcriptional regulator